jgi:hypothetical protein
MRKLIYKRFKKITRLTDAVTKIMIWKTCFLIHFHFSKSEYKVLETKGTSIKFDEELR